MHYSIENVSKLIGARRIGNVEMEIDWLLTDSRSLAFPETTLFFALHTAHGDGHKYIDDLYRRGVRAFVVSALPENVGSRYTDANFLCVASPLRALQLLAERHREAFDIPVIGITGSNGKTVVKEWIYQLLSPTKRVTRSPRSFNSQIGVPLSVWLLNEESDVAIFEAGISQRGEMSALASIIKPSIGVITNLGQAHQENFSSMEEKCLEKLVLFRDCNAVVCKGDDETILKCLQSVGFNGTTIAWSLKDKSCPLFIKNVASSEASTIIEYRYLGKDSSICIPFADNASIENAIHTLAICLYMQMPQSEISAGMLKLTPIAMRLEVKEGVRGCTVINDAYVSDINSLDIALDFMNRRPAGLPKLLILSDLLQTGLPSDELYARIAQMTALRGIDEIIGIGPEIMRHQHVFSTPVKHFYASVDELIASGLLSTITQRLILLKGANRAGFCRLTDLLTLRLHETTLEVDLKALADNLNFYRSQLRPATKLVCMVKASAYGAGSVEVAKTLQDRGVDYLAVAVADEGVELRKAGITAEIIIMNPEVAAASLLFEYHLQPEVYSFSLLDSLIKAAAMQGVTNFPIHIKLDTGMHRLGFDPLRDMPALIARLKSQSELIPRSVFSHFVGSDSPDFDEFSKQQFNLFKAGADALQKAFPHHILQHICNSSGIERFPERHLDMVRLGLGLYGIDPIDNRQLSNVTALKTTILQIHDVPAGDSVGYSRRTILSRNSRIATIPIGYADGLNRRLGNRGAYCIVNGKPAEYVGNICMDVCMIDVTDIPDVKEGDRVEIFGKSLPVTELSDRLGTIPYEVFTSVSDRVIRIYYQD